MKGSDNSEGKVRGSNDNDSNDSRQRKLREVVVMNGGSYREGE